MDYVALKNEILTDPLLLGYAGKSDIDIANLMNAQTIPSSKKISTEDAYLYLLKNLKWRGIELASNDVNNTAYNAAYTAVKLIAAPQMQIDMKDPVSDQLLTLLVNANLITATDKTNLQTLSAANISRATQLGFNSVSHTDVAIALRG